MASKSNVLKKKKNNRNLAALVGSVVILIIVIISFVLSPALSQIGQTQMSDIVLGSYGNEKITFSFLKDTPFKMELASLSNNSSDSMDARLAQVAYNRAVSKAAAIDEFNSNGYLISKDQLDEAVLNSGYYNVNGSFSSKVFKNTTESSKQELRENINRELKVENWMFNTLLQQKRSSDYLKFVSSLSNVKRDFEYVTFEYSDYPDSLVLEYGKNNSKKFTELNLSRITVNKMSTADDIIEKINSNESTFAQLAKIYSIDNFKDNGGEMNSSTYEYELDEIFGITNSDEVLKLTPEGTPLVIEKDGSIILLTVNKEIVEPNFNNLKEVRNYMLDFERGTIEDYFYNEISKNKSNNLTPFGYEIKSTGLFSINYGSEQLIATSIARVSKDPIFARALSNDNFFSILFNLESDTISDPIVLGDTISVFKLKSEVIDETKSDDYVLASLDRTLLNHKSVVSEKLILDSEKYTDNFYAGYFEILKINQGN